MSILEKLEDFSKLNMQYLAPKETKERRILRYFTMKFTTTLITPSDDFIIWSNIEFYQTSGLSRNCWIV